MAKMDINFFEHEENAKPYSAGDKIFDAGEPGEVMYGIQSGTVELLFNDQVIATLSDGDVFGEMALADESTRSATAVAKTDCRLAVMNNPTFLAKIQRQPLFALFMIQTIAERLRVETARGR